MESNFAHNNGTAPCLTTDSADLGMASHRYVMARTARSISSGRPSHPVIFTSNGTNFSTGTWPTEVSLQKDKASHSWNKATDTSAGSFFSSASRILLKSPWTELSDHSLYAWCEEGEGDSWLPSELLSESNSSEL